MATDKIKLEIGQKVMVSGPNNRITRPVSATVTKVGRIYAECRPDWGGMPRRYRLDTQRELNGSSRRFWTMEQWTNHREREIEAERFLSTQGISLSVGAKWTVVELADLIRGTRRGD